MKRQDMPKFGLLNGLKVVSTAISIAGPFACSLMADHGADVIFVENPDGLDLNHGNIMMPGWSLEQNRRNVRNCSLNVVAPEGRAAFLKLIKDADILLEASKGGQWAKWGLTDEVLWEVNPKLVITHISGFGQSGDPEYVSRAAYDPIAQAFGGMMYANGEDGFPFFPCGPDVGDYYAGFMAFGMSLAAVLKARETGKGDSIDIAQYETIVRTLGLGHIKELTTGEKIKREFFVNSSLVAGYGSYPCKSGSVIIMILGPGAFKSACKLLGLEYGGELFPTGTSRVYRPTEAGQVLNKKVEEFCAEHTAEEVEKIFSEYKIPVSLVMEYSGMLENSHYQARKTLTTWKSERWPVEITGANVLPPVKNHPGQIFRSGVDHGTDTDDVLTEAGLTPEEIAELKEKGLSTYKLDNCQQYQHI